MMKLKRTISSLLLTLVACLLANTSAQAQFGFGFNIGGNGNNGGLGGAAGIIIDADGIVQLRNTRPLAPAALKKQVNRYAEEKLPANVVVASPERVVSLRHLETLVSEAVEKKLDLPLEVLCLAGLQRIDSVVFDSEKKDVLLVGPAEAFGPDSLGRSVGAVSGRPTLLLEDLLTAIRASQSGEETIGCSIDPSPENMQALQNYLRQNSTPAGVAQIQQRFSAMANVLGNQEIKVWGVPEESHFAMALVEADIRMKRIALGLDAPGVPGIRTHLSLLKPQGNSLQRWWFVPMYEPLETNAERTVFKLSGQRAQLLAQEEISDSSGHRTDASMTRKSTEKFAQLFTEHFQELADRSVPFARLQNLYDLAVVASLIKIEGARHLRADPFPVLSSQTVLPLPSYAPARSLPSASTYRAAGPGKILGLVGGVTMDIQPVIRSSRQTQGLNSSKVRSAVSGQTLFGDVTP